MGWNYLSIFKLQRCNLPSRKHKNHMHYEYHACGTHFYDTEVCKDYVYIILIIERRTLIEKCIPLSYWFSCIDLIKHITSVNLIKSYTINHSLPTRTEGQKSYECTNAFPTMVWRQHSEKDNGIFIMIPWYFNLAPYILGWYLFKNNYGSVYPPLPNAILSQSREYYHAIRDNYRVIRDN